MNPIIAQTLLSTSPSTTTRHELIDPFSLAAMDNARLDEVRQVVVHDATSALIEKHADLVARATDLGKTIRTLLTGSEALPAIRDVRGEGSYVPERNHLIGRLATLSKAAMMAIPEVQALISATSTYSSIFDQCRDGQKRTLEQIRSEIESSVLNSFRLKTGPFTSEAGMKGLAIDQWRGDGTLSYSYMTGLGSFAGICGSGTSVLDTSITPEGEDAEAVTRIADLCVQKGDLEAEALKIRTRLDEMSKLSEDVRIGLVRQKLEVAGGITADEIRAMSAKLTSGLL